MSVFRSALEQQEERSKTTNIQYLKEKICKIF